MNVWTDWIAKNVPAAELAGLKKALDELLGVEVKVTRVPTEDLYLKPPRFEDVYGLFPLFDTLAFQQNLLLKGPKGVGKSLSVYAYAAVKKIPVVVEDCTEDTKKYELKGTSTAVGGDFMYILGSLPTAIEVANETGACIWLGEELNVLPPTVQKSLNPIADFRRRLSLPHLGKVYELNASAKLWVVGTMNPSSTSGTYDLNEDLRSRFEEVHLDYLPEDKETALLLSLFGKKEVGGFPITRFVRLAAETRNEAQLYSLSPRDLVRLVTNVEKLGLERALMLLMGRAEQEDKKLLKERIKSTFGSSLTIKDTWTA